MYTIVEITGDFDRDGAFYASPWYVYRVPDKKLTRLLDGEYAVHIYDGAGKRLSVTHFDVKDNYRSFGGDPSETEADRKIPIQLFVRFDPQAAKIVILRGNEEIYTRNVSKKPPEARFTGLRENQTISGKTTITWEASGSGKLVYRLWYCRNDTESYILAYDIEEKSFKTDLTDYPGTDRGFFRLYATDGVSTAEAISPLINKQYKAPEIITSQKEIPSVKATEGISLYTRIFDAQDGQMTGDNVRWTLDGKEVATTNVLRTQPNQFTPGPYTFICTATNSAGLSTQKAFTFRVFGTWPPLSPPPAVNKKN